LVRLVNKQPLVTPLDPSSTAQLARGYDEGYRWILRRFMEVIPDVDRYDWTVYVKEGFNIATSDMVLLNAVLVAGYLLPWAILAYYLIKTREIATY
jgi:hypothetical protein